MTKTSQVINSESKVQDVLLNKQTKVKKIIC